MSDWQMFMAFGIGSAAVGLLYSIFQEVRSIRRMMNADRRISNEIQTFDEG